MSNLAIIGGSGIYKLDNIDLIKWIDVKTKWACHQIALHC